MIAAKFCLVLVLAIVIADSGVLGKPASKATKKSAKTPSAKRGASQEDHNAAVAKAMADVNQLMSRMKDPEQVSQAISRMQASAQRYMNSAEGQQAMAKAGAMLGQVASPDMQSRVMEMIGQAEAMVNDPQTASRAAEMVNKSAAELQSAVQAASS